MIQPTIRRPIPPMGGVPLQILVIIIDREKVKETIEYMQPVVSQHKRIHLLYKVNGKGTANSKILDMLGLDAEEKGILFCIESLECAQKIRVTMQEKLHLEKPGNGIIFSLPLQKSCKIQRGETMDQESKKAYSVIITIVNQGYSDELMAAAKKAGARGGTIVRARRIDTQDSAKIFGIHVQLEKEIVMIVVPQETKKEIVDGIKPFCGKESESKGIMFSLAAEDVYGLSFDE